jgi:hypothetical protein
LPLRRRLRVLAGVELWHVEEPKMPGQRTPTIHYLVKLGGSEATFNRPHEAWRYFQQLTDAPDKDIRPDPPPLDAALSTVGKRKPRRRRLSKTSA